MAFPHSFRGSTFSSFNNVSRSILLFVRAPLRGALAGRARSSTQPLRRSRRREFETNGLSCFRLRSAKLPKRSAIDTRRYPRRIYVYAREEIRPARETLIILSISEFFDRRSRYSIVTSSRKEGINEEYELLHASDLMAPLSSIFPSRAASLSPSKRIP